MADKVISLRLIVDTKDGQAKIENVGEELQEVADKAKAAGSQVTTTTNDMTKGFDGMGEAASEAGESITNTASSAKSLKGALTGLIAVGILIVLREWAKLAKDVYLNMTTAATSARELKEATNEAALSVIGEITELQRLSGVISDTNESMRVRVEAIEDIREMMPDYLQNLTDEEILLKGVTDELNLNIEALLLKAEIAQIDKQIEEKSVELLETKQKIEEGELGRMKKYQVSLFARATLGVMENVQLGKKERLESELNAHLERKNELQRIGFSDRKKAKGEGVDDDPNDPNDYDAITKKVVDAAKKREEDKKEAERERKRKEREKERDAATKKADLDKVDNALTKERSKRQAEIEDDESREVRMSHEKYDKLIAILQKYNLDTSSVVEAAQAEQDAIEKKYAEKRLSDAEKQASDEKKIKDKEADAEKKRIEESLENERRVQQAKFDMAQDGIHALADLLDALSKDDEKNAKKAFENNKKRNIAIALIDTFMGAQKAYNSQMQLTPDSPIRAAIAAAIATTTGLARVAAIKKTKFDDPSATTPETPGTAGIGQESGFQQTGFTALPQTGANKKPDPVKVYVLESEISRTQTDVKTIKAAVRL